jgi:hypothetical protein
LPRGKKIIAQATCHPDRQLRGHGLCQKCYYQTDEAKRRAKTYDQAHKDQRNAYRVLREERLRKEALLLLGNACVFPGCTWSDSRAFQIDHIDGGGSKERKTLYQLGIYRKIIRMSNPGSEYQILCANHNIVKKFERGEYRARDEGTIKAIKERLQRGNEFNSKGQLVFGMDESMARLRATSQLPAVLGNGGNGGSNREESLDRSGCPPSVPPNESPLDWAVWNWQEYRSQRHRDNSFDNAPPGWTNQADGFDR